MTPQTYITIAIFVLTIMLSIIGFFLRDLHSSMRETNLAMKETNKTLSEAVNKLTVVITTIEKNHEYLNLRVTKLEEIIKEYHSYLEFLKENKNDLKKILP